MQPKILLVDDREDNLLTLETILENGGYHFVKATSGREALKILLTEIDFALILMDVKMPNLDGFETASLIYSREKLKHIPIIFITAHNYGEENIFKGYRAGAVDYIYKPINGNLLKAKVAVFADLYRKNHQLMVQEQKLIAINKSLEEEIKERKHSEEQVKTLNVELLRTIDGLEAANKELDRFAFLASHDLQEPLRRIFTFSDLLFSKYNNLLQEDGKMYIEKIQSAAKRSQMLIKDILNISMLSSNKNKLVYSDLNAILMEVLADMEENIKQKKAEIITEKLPSLNIYPVLMRPLLYNLISNALKYSKENIAPVIRIHVEMPANSPETPLAISSGSKLPRYCKIFIEDNGIGFDQRYAEQIFVMFTRLHNNKAIEGTGIGLALCKKIVENHNGFISARSKENEGTTFIISLPITAAEPFEIAKRESEKMA